MAQRTEYPAYQSVTSAIKEVVYPKIRKEAIHRATCPIAGTGEPIRRPGLLIEYVRIAEENSHGADRTRPIECQRTAATLAKVVAVSPFAATGAGDGAAGVLAPGLALDELGMGEVRWECVAGYMSVGEDG